MKKLRVLVLMHESLVPPAALTGYTPQQIEEWKTEYDVMAFLREAGHEVRALGLYDNLAELRSVDALPRLLESPTARGPLLVLGEGSNVLFAADFRGLVLRPRFAAVGIVSDDGEAATVRAEAGAGWDALVDWTLARGLAGLENLALIPGLVGAAPIQNIGAYGVEVAGSICSVEAWERLEGRARPVCRRRQPVLHRVQRKPLGEQPVAVLEDPFHRRPVLERQLLQAEQARLDAVELRGILVYAGHHRLDLGRCRPCFGSSCAGRLRYPPDLHHDRAGTDVHVLHRPESGGQRRQLVRAVQRGQRHDFGR